MEPHEHKIDYKIKKKLDAQRIKIKDKDDLETVEEVFDKLTLQALYRIIRKMGLKKIYGVISSGKESRIYRAIDYNGKEYAVKIYLTFTSEFKKSIWKYIYGDPRFKGYQSSTTRKLMSLWARKEYKNLEKMYSSGASVPKPYAQIENIVVMEFIGENGVRAPLLKEIKLGKRKGERYYKQIYENTKKIVCKARLIHADLSEYNIMIWSDKAIIIDVSQSVHIEHPNARMFLIKDIENITRFFAKQVELELSEKMWGEVLNCLQMK